MVCQDTCALTKYCSTSYCSLSLKAYNVAKTEAFCLSLSTPLRDFATSWPSGAIWLGVFDRAGFQDTD